MRADRLISIVLLLQANGRMTAETLASRLEVSQRTILRDMDALSGAGVPVVAERGTGGGWRLIDGYETKLTGLTPAEIRSLFLARPPALLAELGIKEAADAAWLKLRAALPVGVREQAEFVRQRVLIDSRNWRDSAESLTSLPLLLESLWSGHRAEIPLREGRRRVERARGRPARARRTREPLVPHRGQGRRAAHVSRLADPLAGDLGRACEPAEGLRSRGVLGSLDESFSRASAALRRDVPRHAAHLAVGLLPDPGASSSKSRPATGSACRCASTCPTRRGNSRSGLGAELEVLEPQELRDYVIATANAVAAAYAGAPKAPAPIGPVSCSSVAPATSTPGTGPRGP